MNKSKIYIVALTLIGILGCSPKSIIGHYTNSDPNKIAFSGKELSLDKNGNFKLNEWTDSYSTRTDENGEIQCDAKGKGIGKYKIVKDTIELYFENNDFLTCHLNISEEVNSYEMEIEMRDELDIPLEAAIIFISNKNNKLLESKLTDEYGKLDIEVDKSLKPQNLNISVFAAKDLSINIPTTLGKTDYTLKRCIGYYRNKEVEKMWFKAGRNCIKYKRGNKALVKLNRVK